MWCDARWLKLPQEEIKNKKIYHGDMTGRFAYFRCEVELPEKARLTADITASSRYRLWINGKSVLSGPCKGDTYRQYYETVELTEYLVSGKNIFCAQVLYCDPDTAEMQTDERASIYGVIGQKMGHRLAIEGDICDEKGNVFETITTGKADWRVWLEDSFFLKSSEITCFLGAVIEEIDVLKSSIRWKEKEFDFSHWMKAEFVDTVKPTSALYACGVEPRFRMRERDIPLLYERKTEFIRDFSRKDGKSMGLLEKGSIAVPSEKTAEIILDAGTVKNGYPKYLFRGGKGAKVEIIYFEKFGGQGADIRRTDYEHGEISGLTDTLILDGKDLQYEPFWVRTFRFICIRIYAAEEPVTILVPDFQRTGYPLKKESSIHSSEDWVEKLWDICVRTLGNCMLETYMDCPYYEQLQFAMDTRLEALFTYAVSSDSALARKALIDFHYGMQPEGLTAGKYPSVYLQILSTFSLHYIYMLWEYYKQTGDKETLRLCRGDIDRILDYYDIHIGKNGLVGGLEFWEFVDWHPSWADCGGTPRALQYGPSTIINLMYAYALQYGVQLFEATGRPGLVEEYRYRRKRILDAVQRECWDEEKKMYREGPAFTQFTYHAQAWAVLNEMVEEEKAKEVLLSAINDENCLKYSFSTAYEWFRALAKAGMYDEIREAMNEWIELLELDCMTCPETPKEARSECHAWSALPMYEMIRTIAGIEADEIGWKHVKIAPHMMNLNDIQGTAVTPYGNIDFYYEMNDGKWNYSLKIPEGIQATFYFEDGRTQELSSSGEYHLS